MAISVIKKFFSGKADQEAHSEFVKFGKGIYQSRYLIDAKKQKDKWSIKTGAEYANFLVRSCLEKTLGKVKVKGIIVSTLKLNSEIDFPIANIKQFMGVKQLVIDTEVESKRIIELMNKYPKVFFALSFSTGNSELKIKAKAPKSAKPAATGEKQPKAEFCSIKTTDQDIVNDLFFDCLDFKEISISHTLKIDTITLPKGVSDPNEIREKSIRDGSITRLIKIDGREDKKEVAFKI